MSGEGSWTLSPALAWLLRDGAYLPNSRDLVDDLCRRLMAEGLPLWRFSLFFRTLHPEVFGDRFQWQRDTGTKYDATPRSQTMSEAFTRSPLIDAAKAAAPLRRLLAGPEARLDYPLMEELRAAGGTDYLAVPMPFEDGSFAFLTSATDAAGGFAPWQVDRLVECGLVLNRIAEARAVRSVATRLLDIYVGHDAGARILKGQVLRGSGETLRAAIWLCDLRGFTALSDALPRDALIALLNRFFDAMAGPVVADGGEILKFIGDGMLAVFPVRDDDVAAARAALRAATGALAAMTVLNRERQEAGDAPLRCGITLHIGDVMYGNIGAAARLDFTVIGPAVNLAARLQEQCRNLGHDLLFSAPFAALVGDGAQSLGRQTLRGVAAPQEVFTTVA